MKRGRFRDALTVTPNARCSGRSKSALEKSKAGFAGKVRNAPQGGRSDLRKAGFNNQVHWVAASDLESQKTGESPLRETPCYAAILDHRKMMLLKRL